jgi:hypothetical protein
MERAHVALPVQDEVPELMGKCEPSGRLGQVAAQVDDILAGFQPAKYAVPLGFWTEEKHIHPQTLGECFKGCCGSMELPVARKHVQKALGGETRVLQVLQHALLGIISRMCRFSIVPFSSVRTACIAFFWPPTFFACQSLW